MPAQRLRRAQRILGWEMVVASVAVVVFLPAATADQSSIGGAGWALAGLVAVGQVAAGLYLARTRTVIPRAGQLAGIWSLVLAICVFVWLTGGGDSPYNPLFILAAGAVGGQSRRNTTELAVGVIVLALAPVVYGSPTANEVVLLAIIGLLTTLFMAFVTWVAAEIRQQGINQQVQTEAAVSVAEELRKLDEAKDRFISAAAHELRSPLSVVLMQTDELLAGEGGEITDEQGELLEVTKRSAERLNRIVGDLLDLAQMDAGAFALQRTRFSVTQSLLSLSDELAAPALARDIRVVMALDEDITVDGDRTRLEMVFGNVISNAVKYSHDGGEVRVGARRREGQVVIEVADDGVGIPELEIGRIGERFFRARTALGTKGTGLGLAIAREILDLHSATFEIASREGLGTTVVIGLPAGEPGGGPEAATSPVPESRSAGV
jgi:signal transduction histidine kinase